VQLGGEVMSRNFAVERLDAREDGFTGFVGVGVGLRNDFVEDVDVVADAVEAPARNLQRVRSQKVAAMLPAAESWRFWRNSLLASIGPE
jgi:hypothetical protein